MVKIPTMEDSPHTSNYVLNNINAPDGKPSKRLGMATIGEDCTRKMWFRFRWAKQGHFTRRIKRLFDIGHAYEDQVVASLNEAGIIVSDEQFMVLGWGGHIVGFMDGVVTGVKEAPETPHLLEVKSMNDRNFKQFKKKGIRKSHPKYYSQAQAYCGKKGLTRILFACINKNDSEIFTERLDYDQDHYKYVMGRGVDVVCSEIPPPNIIMDPTNFACKFCDYSDICYEGAKVQPTCRSCKYVDLENEGGWSCRLHKKDLSNDEQREGCNQYNPIV
tara:strand:- start:6638 stop:7459 length:822 start_codon:yes stop_codon:yes gene_type:complete